METLEIARLCAQYAADKKAADIVLLDLRGISPVTDFFVIGTATSNPQLRAVRDEIVERLRDEHGLKPLGGDGNYESQWLIVNYPNVLVHVLSPEKRDFYRLEELWGDAPRLPLTEEAEVPVSGQSAGKAAAARKATLKRSPGRTTRKTAAPKSTAKKVASKTAAVKKVPAKKAAAKAVTSKKPVAKKSSRKSAD